MNDKNNLVNNIAEGITKLDEDTVYRGSVHFYSKGSSELTTISVDVSHTLADDFQDALPESYAQVYELVMGLRRNAAMYAADDEDIAMLNDPDLSPEDKAATVLAKISAQEEALTATIN